MVTKIEWVKNADGSQGSTWNPIRARDLNTGKTGWHCVLFGPDCDGCYAQTFNGRMMPNGGTGHPYRKDAPVEVYLDEKTLLEPLRWNKPRTIFPCSMTDWSGEFVPDEFMDRILAVADLTHTLTGRAIRQCQVPNGYEWLIEHRFVEGPVCWVLENVVRLPEPIPCSGKQGLWNWEPPAGLLKSLELEVPR